MAPNDCDEDCGDSLTHLAATGWKLAVPTEGYSWRRCEGSPERRIHLAFHTPSLRCDDVSYSWSFHALDDRAPSGHVGIPGHAMLVLNVQPA